MMYDIPVISGIHVHGGRRDESDSSSQAPRCFWEEDLPEAIAGINGNLFNTSSADLKLSHSLFLKIHIKHQNLIHTIVITDNSNTPFLVRSRFLGHWNDAKILNFITAISKNQEQSFANVFVTAFTRVKKYIDVLHISRYRELFQNSLTYNIILTWS